MRKTKKINRHRREMLIKQRLLGLMFVALAIFIVFLCRMGTTPEEQDATGAIMCIIFALPLLFSRTVIID